MENIHKIAEYLHTLQNVNRRIIHLDDTFKMISVTYNEELFFVITSSNTENPSIPKLTILQAKVTDGTNINFYPNMSVSYAFRGRNIHDPELSLRSNIISTENYYFRKNNVKKPALDNLYVVSNGDTFLDIEILPSIYIDTDTIDWNESPFYQYQLESKIMSETMFSIFKLIPEIYYRNSELDAANFKEVYPLTVYYNLSNTQKDVTEYIQNSIEMY